jgi:hypothetical protein
VSTKDTFRERRGSVAVRHSRERATQSTKPFRFVATKATKREREIHTNESLRKRSFLVRFCFPAVLFADRNSYARKKERTMRCILLSFFRASLLRRRLYIVLMNYVKSVVSASVSLGQFYRYLVRIHHGTQNDAENDDEFKFHFTTTKKKLKRNERRTLKESKRSTHKQRTVCVVRCSNEQIVVRSIRRRERYVHGASMVQKLNFCEV